jgi:hypothetical protein
MMGPQGIYWPAAPPSPFVRPEVYAPDGGGVSPMAGVMSALPFDSPESSRTDQSMDQVSGEISVDHYSSEDAIRPAEGGLVEEWPTVTPRVVEPAGNANIRPSTPMWQNTCTNGHAMMPYGAYCNVCGMPRASGSSPQLSNQ